MIHRHANVQLVPVYKKNAKNGSKNHVCDDLAKRLCWLVVSDLHAVYCDQVDIMQDFKQVVRENQFE